MEGEATSDFSTEGELSKELGLKEALTIGVGTMIGAGIFVLPGTALAISGPAAILAYVLAGVLCMITAASTAELATGMPKSGGAYFFISRSMGGMMGTISGVSVWLSLTFAVAFYLQGFGEYLNLFLPLDSIILAVLAGIFFTYVNYIGAKETGKTQNIIVGILLSILLIYVVWGSLHFDVSTFQPFTPYGIQPIFLTTAIIFVSFLGFVQIASVAEEVKEPGYTLPRAIIGSVAIVTVLYAFVLAVTTGLMPLDELIGYDAPIVESARLFSGLAGGAAITFAALLATASSANASILAASRISFALGRDDIFPDWLNQIHDKYMTPYRPILLTGLLTIVLIVTADVELLSSSASVLMLLNYSLLNITVLIMRTAPPEGYDPDYRSPGYPYLHIIGSLSSLGVIFFAGILAQIVAVGLVVFSLVWYFAWAKNKTVLEGALSSLKPAQLTSIFKKEIPAASTAQTVIKEEPEEMEKEIYRVLTPMANPAHEKAMLNISSGMVKSTKLQGEITLLNVIRLEYLNRLLSI
ncbi:APC family permease [Halarsenatibacter silvermanii]|uniref:Amino acid transporter n=1 Tax=Halarsenatibacter silvermanii TaxID=321763 RepID=A0A1G9KXA8_9FIRM|nr:APC family permease [Halarsenatibacter silvermanii]SDL54236.1 Amino acid transporter [Halarsenatibacter silvermanii]